MLALITKASEDYWYKFKKVKTLKDAFKIYHSIVIKENEYQNWTKEQLLEFWRGFKEEDVPLMQKAKCEIIIYDDYLE